MDYEAFKNEVIKVCAELGVKDYELYYERGESTDVSIFAHEVNSFSSSTDGGICFRAISGGKMGYASTERLDEENARSIVLRALDNASVLEAEEEVFLCEGGKEYEALPERNNDIPTTEELIAKALSTQEELYAADDKVVDGSETEGIVETSEIAIYNSRGLDLHQDGKLAAFVVAAVVSDGKEMADSFEIKAGSFREIDTKEMTEKCAKDAVVKLGGDTAPTGQYPVIFNPDAMSSMLQTFSGIFNSESAQKGLSRFNGKEGEVIAAECLSIIDDPFYKDNPFPRAFDSEGCPTHKKSVVEHGKLNTLLYNLKTAKVAGKETTGNAAKAGYSSSVGIRPFTMYIENGSVTEDELFAEAKDGVYITSVTGLHAGANPVSGDFSLQSSGFMIRDGKKTDEYVKSFTVAGNFYDLLKSVRTIADNCTLPMATGVTTFGSPSVLVDGLSVAGK